MKRAFWFENEEIEDSLEYDSTEKNWYDIVSEMQDNALQNRVSAVQYMTDYCNRSYTENGALGYTTTGNALLDLNFKVSSLRDWNEDCIAEEFEKAYRKDPEHAIKWLFFLRDIPEGMGERRSFKVCLKYLAESNPEVAKAVLKFVPEYGRFDDALVLLDTQLAGDVAEMYHAQLNKDIEAMKKGKPISLLGKWLPSINTSSAQKRAYAKKLCGLWKMSGMEYRKPLSKLRAYMGVVETKISASEWSDVDYDAVPAKANLLYGNAFEEHDRERRVEYLEKVLFGDGKLNAKGLMPYELVHRYMLSGYGQNLKKENLLTELMWKKMCSEGFGKEWGLEDAIVVADGSGSMCCQVSGNTSVTALEVCNSLAIYFAGQLKGIFHDKAITFSCRPQFINMEKAVSLRDKLKIMLRHCECSNTNIEAVFDMILSMAVDNNVPREELPKQVLVISDMEFDGATCGSRPNDTLFDTISKKFEAHGYRMPRLIFWNVCGRTGTIPMVKNGEGLCLLSGFSQNAMKVASHREKKDPYEALIATLDSERYQKVWDAVKDVA